MTPIQGISLERFAELGAEVADSVNDQEACARIVEANGVARGDWDVAYKGWIARMQDPALMGRVAMAYMPLYQAALAKKKGTVDVSFDDFVALSGARAALGAPRFAAQYGLDDTTWTQIAGSWTAKIPTDARYQMYGLQVEQEANRIRQGGAPKAIAVTRTSAGGGTSTQTSGGGGVVAPVPAQAPRNAQELENQMMAEAVRQQVAQVQANASAQASAAYGNVAANVGFLGKGVLGAVGMGAIAAGIGPGMQILVQWSDGKRYPGQCMQVANAQVLVSFGDGRQMWVPETSVSRQGS
jgi:hypothetical protein